VVEEAFYDPHDPGAEAGIETTISGGGRRGRGGKTENERES